MNQEQKSILRREAEESAESWLVSTARKAGMLGVSSDQESMMSLGYKAGFAEGRMTTGVAAQASLAPQSTLNPNAEGAQTNPSLDWKWCPMCGGRWALPEPICESCGYNCTTTLSTPHPAAARGEADDEDGLPVGFAAWYNRTFAGQHVDNTRLDHCERAWRQAIATQPGAAADGYVKPEEVAGYRRTAAKPRGTNEGAYGVFVSDKMNSIYTIPVYFGALPPDCPVCGCADDGQCLCQ